MGGNWWAADVGDLIANGFGPRPAEAAANNGHPVAMPIVHLAGDALLGRVLAGGALKAGAAAFPALLIGGAVLAAATYLLSRGYES